MKIKRLQVSLDLFMRWFMKGSTHYIVIENGVPMDAEIIATEMLSDRILEMTITSSEFDEISNDSPIPELVPVFKDLRGTEQS